MGVKISCLMYHNAPYLSPITLEAADDNVADAIAQFVDAMMKLREYEAGGPGSPLKK